MQHASFFHMKSHNSLSGGHNVGEAYRNRNKITAGYASPPRVRNHSTWWVKPHFRQHSQNLCANVAYSACLHLFQLHSLQEEHMPCHQSPLDRWCCPLLLYDSIL